MDALASFLGWVCIFYLLWVMLIRPIFWGASYSTWNFRCTSWAVIKSHPFLIARFVFLDWFFTGAGMSYYESKTVQISRSDSELTWHPPFGGIPED